jgi:hypothetical protein
MASEIDLASEDNVHYREQLAKSKRLASAIGDVVPEEAYVGLIFERDGSVVLATNIATSHGTLLAVQTWLDLAKQALRERAS